MKKETVSMTRYPQTEGFYVEVIPGKSDVSFWLGHKNSDIKELMFAASAAFAPEDKWESMIAEDLADYTADFREAWLDD